MRANAHRAANNRITSIIEAMVMTAALVWALALFMRLVSFAMTTSDDSRVLSRAVTMATTLAEEFSANPASVPSSIRDEDDGLVATCDTEAVPSGTGIMYHARIQVSTEAGDRTVFSLTSSQYVRGEG